MSNLTVGTLIRCNDVEERRIAFYKEIGLKCIQLAGVYEPWLSPSAEARKASDELFRLFRKYGIEVPTMFLSYPNQDWKHPKTGVGLVPEKTRAERMLTSCRLMNWAKRYGIAYISCHVGFVPPVQDESYPLLIADLKQLAQFAVANDQWFLFETGTETIPDLKRTIEDIGEANVGINFDPANVLIYGNGDPVELVEKLSDRVKVVHCKDANPPAEGAERGKETVLGQGSTNFSQLLRNLLAKGFDGPLIIERELPFGPEQEKDIAEATKLICSIIQ